MATENNSSADPCPAEEVWEAYVNDRHFTFRKTPRKSGAFLYSCVTEQKGKLSETFFFDERDLAPNEVEALPQFIAFVSAIM